MKKYSSYKDSGVEWIGEIPSHWDVIKTSIITDNYDGKRVPLNSEQRGFMVGDYPYWGSNGVVDFINDFIFDDELVLVGEDGSPFFDKYKPVSFYVNDKVWVNNHIHVLKTKSRVLPKYITNSFNIVDYKEYITGSTRDKLTQSDLSRIIHCVPPIHEQQHIVSYLDENTSLIDTLIQSKQKKITLLKEKRTSLINHVVTKGLNPNVEMKDSGVEWIGEIPSHWDVKKLKYFGSVILGKMLCNEDKGGYSLKPYLRSVNIQSEVVDVSDVKEMWFSENEMDKYRLRKGDLLFNEGGDVGRTCMWYEELEECYIQNSVNMVRVNCSERYILYNSILHHQLGYYNSVVDRVSIPHLTKEKLEIIPFIYPPLHEQEQIVQFLDEETSLIDKTISIEERKIELLKEYKQSLISDVVTGKICVLEDG